MSCLMSLISSSLNKSAISVITIASTIACKQEKLFGVHNFASFNLQTNIGKCFISLIDQDFPKSNSLYESFNCNALKLSYSCMNNVKSIISSHNKAIISKSTNPKEDNKNCNCGKPDTCPMDGNCNIERQYNISG